MAHKKAGGSSRNGRDSGGQRLGVKLFGGETCLAGNILVGSIPGVIVGGPERVAEEFGAYVERGAEWVIAGPVDSADTANAGILGEVRALLNP